MSTAIQPSPEQQAMLDATKKMQNEALATQTALTAMTTSFNTAVEASKAARNAANKLQG